MTKKNLINIVIPKNRKQSIKVKNNYANFDRYSENQIDSFI